MRLTEENPQNKGKLSDAQMKKVVEFIKLGTKHGVRIPRSSERCDARVTTMWETGQCTRGQVEEIGTYHFCKQHAQKLKGTIGILEKKGVIYFVNHYKIEPRPYSRVSESSWWDMRGTRHLFAHKRYVGEPFKTEEAAVEFLRKKIKRSVDRHFDNFLASSDLYKRFIKEHSVNYPDLFDEADRERLDDGE